MKEIVLLRKIALNCNTEKLSKCINSQKWYTPELAFYVHLKKEIDNLCG